MVRLCYHCELCGADIATLDVGYVDEMKFGFDCLTAAERQAIITMDVPADTMHVNSLCDACIAELDFSECEPSMEPRGVLSAYHHILH